MDSSSSYCDVLQNFLMSNYSLFFIQYIQTSFTVNSLTFMSSAMRLLLILLVLARIMYLIILSVRFITLFCFPMWGC